MSVCTYLLYLSVRTLYPFSFSYPQILALIFEKVPLPFLWLLCLLPFISIAISRCLYLYLYLYLLHSHSLILSLSYLIDVAQMTAAAEPHSASGHGVRLRWYANRPPPTLGLSSLSSLSIFIPVSTPILPLQRHIVIFSTLLRPFWYFET